MARNQTVFDVLISCPTDMAAEKDIIEDEIKEVTLITRKQGASLHALHWQRDALPMLSESPQDAINKQLLEQADIICAVVGVRVGSPTKGFESGTIEEIHRFISMKGRSLDGRSVQIYFKRCEVDPFDIDISQLQAVKKLKDTASSLGVFFKEFRDSEELRSLVRRAMIAAIEHYNNSKSNLTEAASVSEVVLLEDDSERGLFDLSEAAQKSSEDFVNIMNEISEANLALSVKITDISLILNTTHGVGVNVRDLLQEMAAAIDRVADLTRAKIPQIRESFLEMVSSTSAALSMASDFNTDGQLDLTELLSSMRQTRSSLVQARDTANDFRDLFLKTPNYSNSLKKSIRRLSLVYRDVDDFFHIAVGRVDQLLRNYD